MSTPPVEPGNSDLPEPYPQPLPYPQPPQLPSYAGPEYSGYEVHGWNQPPPRPQGTNGFAIAALICGILGCSVLLLVLAIIFGCVALSQIKKTGQAGRGLAISGLVVAGVWVAAIAVAAAVLVSNGTVDRIGTAVSQSGSAVDGFKLKPGDCFDRPEDAKSAVVTSKPCTAAHDAEAFGTITIKDTNFPSAARLKTLSSQCTEARYRYLDPDRNYPGLTTRYLYPDASLWDRGIHVLTCFFRSNAGPITGLVRPSGIPYTDQQKRYVQAVDKPDPSLAKYEDIEKPTWDDKKEFAAGEAARTQGDIDALAGSPWQDGAQPSIDALVAKLRTQLPHWQDAATAESPSATARALGEVGSTTTERQQIHTALGIMN
jgi:hypothetical protein